VRWGGAGSPRLGGLWVPRRSSYPWPMGVLPAVVVRPRRPRAPQQRTSACWSRTVTHGGAHTLVQRCVSPAWFEPEVLRPSGDRWHASRRGCASRDAACCALMARARGSLAMGRPAWRSVCAGACGRVVFEDVMPRGRCFTSVDLVLDRVSQRQSNGGRGRLVVSASSTFPQGHTSTPVQHPPQWSEKTYARLARA
jgi:hypothetical protein